jgi:CheY-like chemotaxis protein
MGSQVIRRRVRVLLALAPGRGNGWFVSLRPSRYDIVVVYDLDAALDALEDDAFDVLLLDLAMPGALEAAKLHQFLSLDRRSVPVVGLTAQASELDDRHRGALSKCLPVNPGSDALAVLDSMFADSSCTCSAGGEPSRVIRIDAYRGLRTKRV